MKRLISCTLVALFASGCASYFKRKDCEKTNWYQHGFDVAMSGKRLDADDHIKQCQKVEAKMSFTEMDTGFKAGMGKYCTGDNVFAVGKAGKPFAYEMCDGESSKKMKARYTEGLNIFCTPSNAYRFGSSGGVYLEVCPKNVEEAWLTEYRKGRKIWLTAVIGEKEKEVQRLDGEIARLENNRRMLIFRQAAIPNQTIIHQEQVYNPTTGTYQQQTSQIPDTAAQAQRDQLSHEINTVDYEIGRTRQQKNALNTELSKMRTEVTAL